MDHKVLKTIQRGGIRNMDIKRSGSQPSGKGPVEYFTGAVHIDPLFEATDRPAWSAPVSPSSRALGLHGIPIHWPKL